MTTPRNESQLWDQLQELFGLGGYDDAFAKEPYYKFRMRGIGQLKRLMKSRSLTITDVWMTAVYCAGDRRILVRTHSELLSHYREAYDAERSRVLQQKQEDANERLALALDVETDPAWRSRLMRATPDSRERVLTEWKESRA